MPVRGSHWIICGENEAVTETIPKRGSDVALPFGWRISRAVKRLLIETGPEAGQHHFGHGLELRFGLWGNVREGDAEVVAF